MSSSIRWNALEERMASILLLLLVLHQAPQFTVDIDQLLAEWPVSDRNNNLTGAPTKRDASDRFRILKRLAGGMNISFKSSAGSSTTPRGLAAAAASVPNLTTPTHHPISSATSTTIKRTPNMAKSDAPESNPDPEDNKPLPNRPTTPTPTISKPSKRKRSASPALTTPSTIASSISAVSTVEPTSPSPMPSSGPTTTDENGAKKLRTTPARDGKLGKGGYAMMDGGGDTDDEGAVGVDEDEDASEWSEVDTGTGDDVEDATVEKGKGKARDEEVPKYLGRTVRKRQGWRDRAGMGW